MAHEIKNILGYEGQYSITIDGRIFSHKRNRFINAHQQKGYLHIGLRDSNNNQKRSHFLVHRLVALAFIDNELNKDEVNHKDGDRANNHVSNLEWVSRSENNQYAWSHGNKKFILTESHISQRIKRGEEKMKCNINKGVVNAA